MKKSVLTTVFILLSLLSNAQRTQPGADEFIRSVFNISEVMLHDVANPPAAARFYAYCMLSAYETLARNNASMTDLSGTFHRSPSFTKISTPGSFVPEFCATYAMLETGRLILPSGFMLEEKQTALAITFKKKFKINDKDLEANKKYAIEVAAQIAAYSKTDGYFSLSTLPRYRANTNDDGHWYPTPPEYMSAVEPQWKTIRTFFLDSAGQFAPVPPTAFNKEKGSAFFNMTEEVVTIGRTLTTEQRAIAGFWDCNPFAVAYSGHAAVGLKKISPGGHWIGITGIVCRQTKASLEKSVLAHALVALSLHDSFVSCWKEKYRSDRIRPESAINKYVDEGWRPLLQTPPFPEYPSGHSVISTSSAEVLTYLFGDELEYTDTSEEYFGLKPRTFRSFRSAAQEAALSRLYGGIHFRDAIEAGQTQGTAIGKYILSKINGVSVVK